MTVLGVIDPPECNERGVPLDWERCRECEGEGNVWSGYPHRWFPCPTCDGHGSLKAAARREIVNGGGVRGPAHGGNAARLTDERTRCEDCGHPMSEGTWEWQCSPAIPNPSEPEAAWVLMHLRSGTEPEDALAGGVHYSPCDNGCRHGGPSRCPDDGTCHHECADFQPGGYPQGACWRTVNAAPLSEYGEAWPRPLPKREASWRPVDVRTLGWPHDLRPEKLAVLCLRCHANRKEN